MRQIYFSSHFDTPKIISMGNEKKISINVHQLSTYSTQQILPERYAYLEEKFLF